MTSWRLVIATPTLPFPPNLSDQERQIERLIDGALAHGAAVTVIAPRTQTAASGAPTLLMRSKFLLRPVIPGDDPNHREVVTTWIEPPAPGPSRFWLDHPWFSRLDQDRLPLAYNHLPLSAAWALWTSAFYSLLSQLNYEITIIHAFGWQTSLIPPMARCIAGWPSRAATVFSPGGVLPPEPFDPEVRARLRLPQEAPSPTTAHSLLAWGLTYASAWDMSPHDYQRLAVDAELAVLLGKYRNECLLPREPGDPAPEMLERAAIARYASVLAYVRSCSAARV